MTREEVEKEIRERTGVEYWICDGYSNVFTVLVDEEGKPLVYDRSEEE